MVKIFQSVVIDAALPEVWKAIRDFSDLSWGVKLERSEVEDHKKGDQVGAIRQLYLPGVPQPVRERLVSLNDLEHTFTYVIVDAPMPVANYVATVHLYHVTDGDKTFMTWSADFSVVPPAVEAEVAEHIGKDIFLAGMKSLQHQVQRHAPQK